MKTYPIIGDSQQMHAFEIDNWKLGRRRAAQIASLIPGAVVLRQPKRLLSWFREDVFCEFQVNGVVFEIEEPYGDSSRYWIGKQPDGGWCPELDVVEETFRNAL